VIPGLFAVDMTLESPTSNESLRGDATITEYSPLDPSTLVELSVTARRIVPELPADPEVRTTLMFTESAAVSA
jgi:hypothetical protein